MTDDILLMMSPVLIFMQTYMFDRISPNRGFVFPSSVRDKAWGQLADRNRNLNINIKKKIILKDLVSLHFWDQIKYTHIWYHFIHFNGNIYWQLLNKSSCHSYRGEKDHCTVSFSQYFLQYLHPPSLLAVHIDTASPLSVDEYIYKVTSASQTLGPFKQRSTFQVKAFTKSKYQHTKGGKNQLSVQCFLKLSQVSTFTNKNN